MLVDAAWNWASSSTSAAAPLIRRTVEDSLANLTPAEYVAYIEENNVVSYGTVSCTSNHLDDLEADGSRQWVDTSGSASPWSFGIGVSPNTALRMPSPFSDRDNLHSYIT